MISRLLPAALAIPLIVCAGSLSAVTPASDTIVKQVLQTPVAAALEGVSEAAKVRPYGDYAPWNIPVAELRRHPKSDWYSEQLWYHAPSNHPGNFNLGFDEYTYPVYYVDDAVRRVPVNLTWSRNMHGKRVPWNPDWKPAPGTDSQVIILDPKNGREWNFYKVEFKNGVVHGMNGNRVPGDYRTRVGGFQPSRGVGIPYLAMLVRPHEIAAGKIEHALSLPIRNPSGQYFVRPATKLERATGQPGIPEGMRFALDVTEAEIQDWARKFGGPSSQTRRSAIIIARALRDYGWFITDTSGGATFQFEANVTARSQWEALGLGNAQAGGPAATRDMLDGLMRPDRIYAIVPSNRYPEHLHVRRGR